MLRKKPDPEKILRELNQWGIKSHPPHLTMEDIDRFLRVNFDEEKGELPYSAVIFTTMLTQPPEKLPPNFRLFDEAPFPFDDQTKEVQIAIMMKLWRRNNDIYRKSFEPRGFGQGF